MTADGAKSNAARLISRQPDSYSLLGTLYSVLPTQYSRTFYSVLSTNVPSHHLTPPPPPKVRLSNSGNMR